MQLALDDDSRELLRMAMQELNLSACAHDRILKVARTIADLESTPDTVSRNDPDSKDFECLITRKGLQRIAGFDYCGRTRCLLEVAFSNAPGWTNANS